MTTLVSDTGNEMVTKRAGTISSPEIDFGLPGRMEWNTAESISKEWYRLFLVDDCIGKR